jgi:hypothetical protein
VSATPAMGGITPMADSEAEVITYDVTNDELAQIKANNLTSEIIIGGLQPNTMYEISFNFYDLNNVTAAVNYENQIKPTIQTQDLVLNVSNLDVTPSVNSITINGMVDGDLEYLSSGSIILTPVSDAA